MPNNNHILGWPLDYGVGHSIITSEVIQTTWRKGAQVEDSHVRFGMHGKRAGEEGSLWEGHKAACSSTCSFDIHSLHIHLLSPLSHHFVVVYFHYHLLFCQISLCIILSPNKSSVPSENLKVQLLRELSLLLKNFYLIAHHRPYYLLQYTTVWNTHDKYRLKK